MHPNTKRAMRKRIWQALAAYDELHENVANSRVPVVEAKDLQAFSRKEKELIKEVMAAASKVFAAVDQLEFALDELQEETEVYP